MRVLFAVAELYPWVKTGGLGDVAAALPPALAALGIDVRLLLPGFTPFLDAFGQIEDVARLAAPFATERVRIARARLPESGLLSYLVDHPAYYDRPGSPYLDPAGHDWADNHRRFGLFGWAAAALAVGADPGWRPEILHAHDWHAGLAPAYLAARGPREALAAATLFTAHNLAYQGAFPGAVFSELHLPPSFFAIEGVEFFGEVSFLKAGIQYAGRLSTVSPTYAREIMTPEFGAGLDGLLRRRAGDLTGILNGVDPHVWDPRHDSALPRHYGIGDAPIGKRAAKQALRERFRLAGPEEAPLFGAVSRLSPQKGLDLVLAALPQLIDEGCSFVLLGSGDTVLEHGFAQIGAQFPGRVGVEIGYDESLSHLIVAGADILAVPSRFEPCGLTQLYALRYGTLPLARRVGGLADTIVDATPENRAAGEATGFLFDGQSVEDFLAAAGRAFALYREGAAWAAMMRRAMTRDFSWARAARQYRSLYRELRRNKARPRR